MQVCLVYFEGLEEPQSLRDYFRSADSFEVSMKTWLVAHPQGPGQLYFELKKRIALDHGLVVVPLEPHLLPLFAQNAGPLFVWIEQKQNELK